MKGFTSAATALHQKPVHTIILIGLILLGMSAPANALNPRRFTQVKTWKGSFNSSLPSAEETGSSGTCSYTHTRTWTITGECTLNLDHNIEPPDNMVATWKGTGSLSGLYHDEWVWTCTGETSCLTYTETEDSSVLEPMDPVDDYYFLDINYYEGATLNTYHFVTQNATWDTTLHDTCSGDTDISINGFGPFENDYYTPLPASGLTLKGSDDKTYYFGDQTLNVPFNWTLTPLNQTDSSIKIIKLHQPFDYKPGPETDVVFSSGKLVVVAKAKVTPANLVDLVTWDVPKIGDDEGEVKKMNNPLTGVAKVTVTYKKLPASNDDFGSKTITANVPDYELSDSKNFRVFFERDKTDHPDTDGAKSANWYYYWKQGAAPKLDQFTYDESAKGGHYDWFNHALTIGKDAPEAFGPMSQPLTDKTGTHAFTLIREYVDGLQAVAAIVAHELQHKFLVEKVVATDQDHDMVRYEEEESVAPWTDYEEANTYGLSADMFYGDTKKYVNRGPWGKRSLRQQEIDNATRQLDTAGDNEVKAIMAEKNRSYETAKDWAYPGSQYGK